MVSAPVLASDFLGLDPTVLTRCMSLGKGTGHNYLNLLTFMAVSHALTYGFHVSVLMCFLGVIELLPNSHKQAGSKNMTRLGLKTVRDVGTCIFRIVCP